MTRTTTTFDIDGIGSFRIALDLTMGEKIRLKNQIRSFLGEQYASNEAKKREWYATLYQAAEVALGITNQADPIDAAQEAKENERRVDEFLATTDMIEKELLLQLEHEENKVEFAFLFPVICQSAPAGFDTNLINCTDEDVFNAIWVKTIAARMPDQVKKKP
jgi:hypothetical protein